MRFQRRLAVAAGLMAMSAGVGTAQQNPQPPRAGLTLTGPWEDGGLLPLKFTRMAENPISPKLEWKNTLPKVASFTLIVHDPDSARNFTTEDVLHWMIVNIPGDARELAEGIGITGAVKLPNGAMQMKSRTGMPGYVAMAAASGPFHHYSFELYELDIKLDVSPDATRAEVLKAMDGHVIERASTMGRFRRDK